MTSNMLLHGSVAEQTVVNIPAPHLSSVSSRLVPVQIGLPEILFITSYPPRVCGIATYSQDLVNALSHQFKTAFTCSICALESDTERHAYGHSLKYVLNTSLRNSFVKTAFQINREGKIKLVVIQHEFGFYARHTNEFESFYTSISKPVVFVFHTVLPGPDDTLKMNVQRMAISASSIVVMTNSAASILVNEYDISEDIISVIPHGTHLVIPIDREVDKEKFQLSNRKVLSTFGLLGSSKSIETTLRALPAVIKKHPEVLFLVLGKTHPSIVEQEGEQYRKMLEETVEELNIAEHVRFVNEYLQLPTLLKYLQLSDIYLFTSKDPNQAVSGTFSYAVSSGCPVISTPIPHAIEVLSHGNGMIIDFESSGQLSTAIDSLLDNEKLRREISSTGFHVMASTAWQNTAISYALLFERIRSDSFSVQYDYPDIHLSHIQRMTTEFGMIQFAKISIPDHQSGYTLDDNSRALIALCQHYELFQCSQDLKLISIYFQFIKYCLQPNGQFLNYVNEQGEFTQQNFSENLEDSTGRAIWALGYVISMHGLLPVNMTDEAEELVQSTLPQLDGIHSTRAMAFILKGLYFQNRRENRVLVNRLGGRLVRMYRHVRTNDWRWFEDYLTYGNSLLPDALLCAYLRTGETVYKEIAIESFDFLLSKIFVNGQIKVISNKGWYFKESIYKTISGGEQPIDVAYTVIALEQFYTAFGIEEYRKKAKVAFSWFLGNNHLHQIVYNPCTGGCYDGVEEHNVNLNQGAESTLSYLMARLTMEQL